MTSNRVVVVSGVSKGIGKYLVDYYLEKNDIVIGCSRSKSNITNTNYEHHSVDVSSVSQTGRDPCAPRARGHAPSLLRETSICSLVNRPGG